MLDQNIKQTQNLKSNRKRQKSGIRLSHSLTKKLSFMYNSRDFSPKTETESFTDPVTFKDLKSSTLSKFWALLGTALATGNRDTELLAVSSRKAADFRYRIGQMTSMEL